MLTGDAVTLEIALRVLGAINERREPEPEDVLLLRRAREETAEDQPADELACEMINRLKHRV